MSRMYRQDNDIDQQRRIAELEKLINCSFSTVGISDAKKGKKSCCLTQEINELRDRAAELENLLEEQSMNAEARYKKLETEMLKIREELENDILDEIANKPLQSIMQKLKKRAKEKAIKAHLTKKEGDEDAT